MKIATTLVCFFSLIASILAQINHTIIGTAQLQDGFAPSGNVVALSSEDSTFLKGDFFLDGEFQLSDLEGRQVIIRLTSLEFDDVYLNVPLNKDTIDLGLIQVEKSSTKLDEVVLRARRPLYVQQADGTMAVLVENSNLAASNSLTEILSKSPDVLVDENGAITVFGKGSALIYLNGKRIEQSQLRLLSPGSIKKLLIIRNPSAKYDAEGSAVIDIQTTRNAQQGYQAKFMQNVSYSDFAGMDTYSDLNIALSKGAFSSTLNYALLQGRDRHILNTTRSREAEEIFLNSDLVTEWQHQYENFSNYGAGLQYDYGRESYISLEYSGFYEQLGGNQLSTNTIEDRTSKNFYDSDIQRNEQEINNGISFNFQNSLDTLGSHLFVGSQYSNFTFHADNPINENSLESNLASSRKLKTDNNRTIEILSGQLDYAKVFQNKSRFELGAKYSTVGNGSDLDFSIADSEDNYVRDEVLSNRFNYQESIFAAYANYSGQASASIQYSLGLRSEYTDYSLELSQEDGINIEDRYFNLFPQISVTKTFANNRSINLSYTSRIRRVPYQRLNPVLLYQDPYTSIQGNPESIPEKIQAIELNANINKTNLRLAYTYTRDPFGGGAVRGENERSYILMRLNFDYEHSFYTSISRTFETAWISSTNTASVRYTEITDKVHNFADVGSKPNFYVYSNNRIPVREWFNLEMTFYYLGDNHEGLYQRKSYWNMTVAVDKSFFNKSLKCRLIANDLFHSVRAAGDYSIGETDIYFARKWNTNYLRMSISYNFGKLSQNKYKNRAIGGDENGRAR